MSNTETETSTNCEQEILNKAVDFPLGIPGFPELKRFVFAQHPEEYPFAWMRSLDNENLGFAVIEAYHLIPDFSFEVADEDLIVIGSPSPQKCAVFFIVQIEASEKVKVIVNSHAPLLINVDARKARQVMIPTENPKPTTFEF